MFTYSTCRDCGGLLHVTDGDTVHPGCTPRPTRLEALLEDYLAAVKMGDQMALIDDLQREVLELESAPPRLGESALVYVSWGWAVFPLLAADKAPATKHGFHDATLDVEQVRAWWERHPESNIGLPTGHMFDVIDVDMPLGPASLDKILAADELLSDVEARTIPDVHGRVITASGGQHLYIEPTGDANGSSMTDGIDYRGLGGYVVAPPSVLSGGAAWRWDIKPSPAIRKGGA